MSKAGDDKLPALYAGLLVMDCDGGQGLLFRSAGVRRDPIRLRQAQALFTKTPNRCCSSALLVVYCSTPEVSGNR